MKKEEWSEIAKTFENGIKSLNGGAAVKIIAVSRKEVTHVLGNMIDGVPEVHQQSEEWKEFGKHRTYYIRASSIVELEEDGIYTILKTHGYSLLVPMTPDEVAHKIGWC